VKADRRRAVLNRLAPDAQCATEPVRLTPALCTFAFTRSHVMTDPQTITVYNFRILDEGTEMARQADFKAPREQILASFNAEILEGTAEDVPASELDSDGRYRRIATGWGEL
jgi:hypothetical protein